MPFSDLHLSDALLKAVEDSGYAEPTAIQKAAIPSVLMGKDLIGVAQTGTGKTASFVLPMLDILAEGRARARMPRSLILEPTRELAAQVAENFEQYGKYHKLSMVLLIGGVSFGDQDRVLEKGVDVLIATPGRLLDQHQRGKVLLSGIEVLVIDEADRMLDMGFIPDVERICALLRPDRQTLLFSATMPPQVKKLADQFMHDPRVVEVARQASTNRNIHQTLVAVESRGKRELLRRFLRQPDVTTSIVFCNRKTTVRELATSLKRHRLRVGQIHGDMQQADRNRELDRFRNGEIDILVASDVAARGLDIKGVSHVFNFDVPWHPDDYVHRVGRTGRAGHSGEAITFVTSDDQEAIERIESLTNQKIAVRQAPAEAGDEAASRPAGRSASADRTAGRSADRSAAAPGDQTPQPRSRRHNAKDAESHSAAPRSDRSAARSAPGPDRAADRVAQSAPSAREKAALPAGAAGRDGPADDARPPRPRREADAPPPAGEDGPAVDGFGSEGTPAFLLVSARRSA